VDAILRHPAQNPKARFGEYHAPNVLPEERLLRDPNHVQWTCGKQIADWQLIQQPAVNNPLLFSKLHDLVICGVATNWDKTDKEFRKNTIDSSRLNKLAVAVEAKQLWAFLDHLQKS